MTSPPSLRPDVEAIIEYRRTMKEQREFARVNRERIDAEWDALTCPPRTIAEHSASLSPERRAELQEGFRG
jgi:hypothetical protein